MTPDELLIADALVTHQLDLLQLDEHTRNRILSLLDGLGSEVEQMLSRASDLTDYSKARLQKLLNDIVIVVDDYYTKAQSTLTPILHGVARVQSSVSANIIVGIHAAIPSSTYLERLVSNVLIQGAPSAEWWSRQSASTAFRFSTAVRMGLAAGETNEQIVSRVAGRGATPGVMGVAKTDARALVHTSIQTVANAARLDVFQRNASVIKGVRQLSTLDSHTTPVCIAYDQAEWDLDGSPMDGTDLPFNGGPPRHWNCRSVLVPITKTFRELGIDMPEVLGGGRASGTGQLAAGTSFRDWLDRQPVDKQNAILGTGRAQMWRSGKITLQQLLNMRGRELSLAELERKYGT